MLKTGVVKITEKQELLLFTEQIIPQESSNFLEELKQELDDYRTAINENTNEIEANYEYIREVEKKIDILSKKIDELTLFVKGKKEEKNFDFSPLTEKEKQVFFTLYVQTELQPFTTYDSLAKKLNLSSQLVSSYITNMLEKGIPIIKRYSEGVIYIKLEENFRQLQAKKNIVGVNTLLTYWF